MPRYSKSLSLKVSDVFTYVFHRKSVLGIIAMVYIGVLEDSICDIAGTQHIESKSYFARGKYTKS